MKRDLTHYGIFKLRVSDEEGESWVKVGGSVTFGGALFSVLNEQNVQVRRGNDILYWRGDVRAHPDVVDAAKDADFVPVDWTKALEGDTTIEPPYDNAAES